jgi:TolB-like protein
MKKIIIFTLILLSQISALSADESETTFAKRRILILPFVNKNKIAEYDYLSVVLMDSIRSELSGTDKYEFANYTPTEEELKDKYKKPDYADIKTAKYIATKLMSDIVVTGQYVIFGKKILILVHIIDLLSGELVGITKVEGNTGVGIFFAVNDAVNVVSEKIRVNLQDLDQKKYIETINMNYKFLLTPIRKTGLGLIIAGGISLSIGFVLLSFPVKMQNPNISSDAKFVFFPNLITSLYLISLGVMSIFIGIPLLTVTIKKNIELSINLNGRDDVFLNQVSIAMRIRL